MSYQSINPFDGKTLKSFDTCQTVNSRPSSPPPATCFKTWKHTTYAERAVIVAKAAELMKAHVDDFATLATLEMGKRIDEARGEVKFSGDILAYYAKNAEKFLAPDEAPSRPRRSPYGKQPDRRDLLRRALELPVLPVGTRRGSAPDGRQRAGGQALQAACRNARLLSRSYGSTLARPTGLYTNLLISHEQSDRVIDDPRIKGVALTGSVAAGRSIAARAGQNPQEVIDGARRQRRLHRARRCRSREDHSVGGLGTHVQPGPDLLRGQALHRLGVDRRQVPREVPGRAGSAEARRPDG